MDEADYPILRDIPTIFPDLEWVWEGFHSLSSARQRGYGTFQPLQISEIKAYADDRNLPGYERTEFREFIQFLDKIYMEHMDKKTSTPQRPPGK